MPSNIIQRMGASPSTIPIAGQRPFTYPKVGSFLTCSASCLADERARFAAAFKHPQRWRSKRDEFARIPTSGKDCAAAAKMGGRKPNAARVSPTRL